MGQYSYEFFFIAAGISRNWFWTFVRNPPVFRSVVMESASLSHCCYGIHQSFTLLLWNPPVFRSVAMESASLSLRCYGIRQSFALLLWNPPVFRSVAMESISCYSLACGPNMAATIQAFREKYYLWHMTGVNSSDDWRPGTLHALLGPTNFAVVPFRIFPAVEYCW